MKKNIKKRIIFIICLIICLFFIIAPYSNADVWDDLETKMNKIQDPNAVNSTKVSSVMTIVINLIRATGAGIAVIMVTITGVKYIYSSPEDKAEYKKKLIPIAIGAVLLVSATELIAKIGDVAMNL